MTNVLDFKNPHKPKAKYLAQFNTVRKFNRMNHQWEVVEVFLTGEEASIRAKQLNS